ncbi:MAG: hypothetical protein CYPHOPRED_001173 [Cyphobasidiales sp. Tagirdzhanova-0007]|nr:MAG: hypothetical protein CYPHOPRED_001173 [Cyphobasidiales sp. Tagirdzhanova-0007]
MPHFHSNFPVALLVTFLLVAVASSSPNATSNSVPSVERSLDIKTWISHSKGSNSGLDQANIARRHKTFSKRQVIKVDVSSKSPAKATPAVAYSPAPAVKPPPAPAKAPAAPAAKAPPQPPAVKAAPLSAPPPKVLPALAKVVPAPVAAAVRDPASPQAPQLYSTKGARIIGHSGHWYEHHGLLLPQPAPLPPQAPHKVMTVHHAVATRTVYVPVPIETRTAHQASHPVHGNYEYGYSPLIITD